ncbi:PadR family transcriptional regulator [Dactylosporangium sp. CA-092794]|uniref:PadR family transcriptional regulator n=1 Tax=Dactylosporangium sp. CA-092794 TaxID=3239929 RepID=UPI003D89E03F
MALRHAILSALSRGEPRTGYELNASFRSNVDRAWQASPSQVYAELTRMEQAGYIKINERDERGRTEYVITAGGMDELRRWLVHDNVDRSIRDDAILRLLTVWVLDDETARYIIEAEIAYQRKRQMDLRRLIETWNSMREDNRVWRTRRAMHDLWLAEVNVMLRWLNGLLKSFEEPQRDIAEIFDETSLLDG